MLIAPFACVARLCKSRRIIYRQIRQNLAIQFDASDLQAVDELVIAHAIQLRSGADAHNPERAELPLRCLRPE